ncbi:M28 family peptidase [Actinoplanes sp. NPDC049596]|uniref:M28 family metallopeptidase n=1 Tax=unclassified Actinoplanes TaxID=2626549 RepID=UPI003438C0B7
MHEPGELLSIVEGLAGIPRLPGSEGEARAGALIRDDLVGVCRRVVVEPERAYASYARPIGLLCATALGAAMVAARGHRGLGSVVAGLAGAGIADDITGGRMAFRRMSGRPGTTANVVAQTGDDQARTTLVVLAHHDAAPSGVVFDQRVHKWVARRWPRLIARAKGNPPLWWVVLAGPVLVALGSAINRASWRNAGAVICAGSVAAMADIGRRPAVPGANDNLSGVAVLISLARALHEKPLEGLRVLLVSAGAEEALQEGIRGFARRHFGELDPAHTYFLNLDTVGSGRLVLLEGEGPLRMHDYRPEFLATVAECADLQDIAVVRGLRARNSTDGSVPHRYGYPTATVVSVDRRGLMPHYHLDSDVPANLDPESVAEAARLAEAVARRLATSPPSGAGAARAGTGRRRRRGAAGRAGGRRRGRP